MSLCNTSKFSEDSLKSGTHYQCFSIPPGMALWNKYIYLQSALLKISTNIFSGFWLRYVTAQPYVIIFPCEDRQDKLPAFNWRRVHFSRQICNISFKCLHEISFMPCAFSAMLSTCTRKQQHVWVGPPTLTRLPKALKNITSIKAGRARFTEPPNPKDHRTVNACVMWAYEILFEPFIVAILNRRIN